MSAAIRAVWWALWASLRPAGELHRAPFHVRYRALFRVKFVSLIRREPLAMHLRQLLPGDRLIVSDKERPWVHHTLLVVIGAYRDRYGQWVPPYTVDVTGEYTGDISSKGFCSSAAAYVEMLGIRRRK